MIPVLQQIQNALEKQINDPGTVEIYSALQLMIYFQLLTKTTLNQPCLSMLWRDVYFAKLELTPCLRKGHHRVAQKPLRITLEFGKQILRLHWWTIGLKRQPGQRIRDQKIVDCPRRTIQDRLTRIIRQLGFSYSIAEIKGLSHPQEPDLETWNRDRSIMKGILQRWPNNN